MRYFVVFVLLFCLAFSAVAQNDSAKNQGSTSVGVHVLYHSFPEVAAEDMLLNIIVFTRMGVSFKFLGNLADSQAMGGEVFLDMDILSFLTSQNNDYNGLGIFEVGGRLLYCYHTGALRVTPLAGIRYTTWAFITGGCTLEGGLKLGVALSDNYELEAEGTYTFYGFGDTFYNPHVSVALALNFYL